VAVPGPSPAPPPRRSRAGVAVAVVVVVLVVASAAAYYLFLGPGSKTAQHLGPATIDLLPSARTRSSCLLETPGAPSPELPLGTGALATNTYSVPNGTVGHVGMCYDATSGSVAATINWTHVGRTGGLAGAGGFFSYPEVSYGVDSWAGAHSTYTNQSPYWTLPATVSSVTARDIWTTLSYSFQSPSATDVTGYDFSLDDFFTQSLPPTFEQGAFVEVMVWFAHHDNYPKEFLNWSAPTLVNSAVTVQPWAIGYWCHGGRNSSNGNLSIDFSYEGQDSAGLAAGTVGVNLSLFLSEAESLMPAVRCWTGPTGDFAQFYFDQANVGSENGARANDSDQYGWTLGSYCFHTSVANATGSSVRCGAGASVDSPAPSPVWSASDGIAVGIAVPGSRPAGDFGRLPPEDRRAGGAHAARIPSGRGTIGR
jgi:hypothetical protein